MALKKLFILALTVGVVFSLAAFSSSGPKYVKYSKPAYKVHPDDVATKSVPNFQVPNSRRTMVINSDSVGFTYYDFGSNGNSKRNIWNYGDGTASVGRMASSTWDGGGTAARGTYWAYYDGLAWTEDWIRVETVRKGWGNIGVLPDRKEVLVSHTGGFLERAQTANTFGWDEFSAMGSGTWPSMVMSGTTCHFIATDGANEGPQYSKITDVGGTPTVAVDHMDLRFATGLADSLRAADGYDIVANGNNLYVVTVSEGSLFSGVSGTVFGNVYLMTSTDGGTTWASTAVHTNGGTFPQERCFVDPYIFLDGSGNPHIIFSTLTAIANDDELYYSDNNAIMHWSAATGLDVVVDLGTHLPNWVSDSTTVVGADQNIGYLGVPSGGVDASGTLYVTFQGVHALDDTAAQGLGGTMAFYYHMYACASEDGGNTWNTPTDLSGGSTYGWDYTYPSMAGWVGSTANSDDYWAVVNVDQTPGSGFQAGYENSVGVRVVRAAEEDITGIGTPKNVLPTDVTLRQNYPNPFNPGTSIAYDLSKDARVELKVYNVLGQEVATLVKQFQTAGSYNVRFDASGLASGIYFYTLKAGNVTKTKKMLLVK